MLRWQLEVTFQEVRTHLGVETQRQWSDLAITRTTPVLLGLFSWITLAAHALQERHPMIQRRAAWYDKPSPTFVDAIALVRRHLWLASEVSPGRPATPIRKNSPPLCTTDWWIPSLTPPEMRKVQVASDGDLEDPEAAREWMFSNLVLLRDTLGPHLEKLFAC